MTAVRAIRRMARRSNAAVIMGATCRAIVSLVALLSLTAPAAAIPPPPPSATRYGPVIQCLAGYKIAVSGEEAISLGNGTTLIADRLVMKLFDTLGESYWASAEATLIEVPGLGQVMRLAFPAGPAPDGPSRDIPPRFEYNLPALGGGHIVTVVSDNFDGSAADLALLARITPVAVPDACGTFGVSDYAGASPVTSYRSPVIHDGPAFRCANGVGFPIDAGARWQRNWLAFDPVRSPDSETHLFVGDKAFRVRLANDPIMKMKGYKAGKPVLGVGFTTDIRDYGGGIFELLVIPPKADTLPHVQRYGWQMSITYSEGEEAAARALAARLIFVKDSDARCGAGDKNKT